MEFDGGAFRNRNLAVIAMNNRLLKNANLPRCSARPPESTQNRSGRCSYYNGIEIGKCIASQLITVAFLNLILNDARSRITR